MPDHRLAEPALARRRLLRNAALAGAAAAWPRGPGALAAAPEATLAPARPAPAGVSMRGDGSYESVPLVQDSVHVGVVQSRVRPVDAANPKPGLKENLAHMLELIDAAQGWGGRKDLLLFHEFPLTGFRSIWSRREPLGVALEVPGAETEVLAGKAREHGCYLVFGTYAKDREWRPSRTTPSRRAARVCWRTRVAARAPSTAPEARHSHAPLPATSRW